MLKNVPLFLCAIAISLTTALPTLTQTTIFNIPTAETLQSRSWALEGDLVVKPTANSRGGFRSYGYRVAYGVDNKTEVGANFYFTRSGSPAVAQSEFSIKRSFYLHEKHGLNVAGGAIVFLPLRNRTGDRTSVLTYANASKSVARLGGTTLTGGVYHVSRGSREFGTRTGGMLGVVQPVARRVSFVADWYTGRNRLGYASAGVNFNLTTRQYLLSGYSFGNSGAGNNALAVYYGYIW